MYIFYVIDIEILHNVLPLFLIWHVCMLYNKKINSFDWIVFEICFLYIYYDYCFNKCVTVGAHISESSVSWVLEYGPEPFLLFDVDGTGKITTRELGPFLKCLGQSYTNSEVE